MGKKFILLQQLDTEHQTPKQESKLPPGIKYQEYILEVDGEDFPVLIPLRECDAFEETLSKIEDLGISDLREILRKHRGIKA